MRFGAARLDGGQRAVQLGLEEEGGDNHRHERRYDEFLHHADGRDVPGDPEHDGRHVADGREGSAGVGRQDDE